MWVYNVYNLSPASYSSEGGQSTLPALAAMLEREGEHIIIGDFNLHRPDWNSENRFTQHAASAELIRLANVHGLLQATQPGIATRETVNSESTLDLTFLQQDLHSALLSCEVRRDLHHGSDHLLVATYIGLEVKEVEERLRRAWKSANPEAVAKLARETSLSIPKLCLREAVDS